jgi:putative FmdB family regulatory protein
MPTYDYVCSGCGHRMEVAHPIHGHGPSACPKCGGPMKKAFTPLAVHFKGTGWARKERSRGRAPAASAERPAVSTSSESGAAENGGSNSAPSSESASGDAR